MGAVYEVVHKSLGRSFAMKKLAADLVEDEEALMRFRREAEVVARFRHPNIVEVSDWETLDDGSPCIIMEFLSGEDLAHRLRRSGPLPWPSLGRIADQVMSALSVAHRGGIVHRDLKPQNIFLARDDTGDERAKLLDFGVSKIRGATAGITTTNERLLGTPLYMSPDQAEGQAKGLGPETDVWAMGAILFEMATARPAFAAASMPTVLYRICFGQPEPLPPHRPDAPAELVELVSRALSRDPARRLMAIDDLRLGLRHALMDAAPGMQFDRPLSIPGVAAVSALGTTSPAGGSRADSLIAAGAMNAASEPSSSVFPTTLSGAIGQSIPGHAARLRGGRGRLAWVLGGTAAALALAVAAVVVLRAGRTPTTTPATDGAAVPPASAAQLPDASTAPPQLPVRTQESQPVTVVLVADPKARVFLGEKDVGSTPYIAKVTPGTPVIVRLEKSGFEPLDVVLDGEKTTVERKLAKVTRTRDTRATAKSNGGRRSGDKKDNGGGYKPPEPKIQKPQPK